VNQAGDSDEDGPEAARLAALLRLDILDTGTEPGFDDIVALARALTGAEAALVSLIDSDRQWFKAKIGTDVSETPRSIAFCDHAIRKDEVMVVLDATRDPRFAENPLVTGPPHIRFYAGAPIRIAGGHAIGTVCVLGMQPRLAFDHADSLAALARQVAALIELRERERHGLATRDAVARDFDRLWSLAHDLIMIADLEGRVIAANPAWQGVFGPPAAPGVIAMRDFLIDPAGRPDLNQIPDGQAEMVTRDYRGADGATHSIAWTLRREGALIYAIGRDDTALRTAERELLQAQKMESLGQLTGGIAHDFNNLLTIIVGNLDIAQRRLATRDLARVERAIGEAGEGASRAAMLTQRLLAFARRQRLAPRAIAPALLLADMRALIERSASEAITVEIVVEDAIWPIEIDVNQLENTILNLAVNARDAMAGLDLHGMLTISAGNAVLDAAEARRNHVGAGDYVRISLADTGTGMTSEVRARAFEPFFTTKGIGRGTGLGLSQVDGFVRQSGGFVTLDTAPGEGTVVHLWLPRTETAPIDPPAAPLPPISRPRGACVMVVEDNDSLRELVVETLRDAGYRVIEAHDGRSALSLFARQASPPELVLSDVMMPLLDGFALSAEIRTRSPATQILLMSGYSGAPAGAGEQVLLVKPFTPGTLLERVRISLETSD
jgi:signal transduction histidine kinase/CheY-like chemotaxis protein